MELIDRLKTIKALDEAKIRTTSEEYDRILDVIGSMPTINRLIPITERMPDIGVPVLTFDGYVFLVEKRIEWIWGDNEKIYSERWVQGYDADNENPIGLRDGAVTAWMPLPKPYEGSEEE